MTFVTEADLCREFERAVPSNWTVYNETGNFDMVLVHDSGFRIGVEAKTRFGNGLSFMMITMPSTTMITKTSERTPRALWG